MQRDDDRKSKRIQAYRDANGDRVRVYQRPSGDYEAVINPAGSDTLSSRALGGTIASAIQHARDQESWTQGELLDMAETMDLETLPLEVRQTIRQQVEEFKHGHRGRRPPRGPGKP